MQSNGFFNPGGGNGGRARLARATFAALRLARVLSFWSQVCVTMDGPGTQFRLTQAPCFLRQQFYSFTWVPQREAALAGWWKSVHRPPVLSDDVLSFWVAEAWDLLS